MALKALEGHEDQTPLQAERFKLRSCTSAEKASSAERAQCWKSASVKKFSSAERAQADTLSSTGVAGPPATFNEGRFLKDRQRLAERAPAPVFPENH